MGKGQSSGVARLWLTVAYRMLVNTSQQIDRWKQYFPRTQVGPDNPQEIADSWLGLLVNMFNIGSILSFFLTYVVLIKLSPGVTHC